MLVLCSVLDYGKKVFEFWMADVDVLSFTRYDVFSCVLDLIN
jgi:hypothetical protein